MMRKPMNINSNFWWAVIFITILYASSCLTNETACGNDLQDWLRTREYFLFQPNLQEKDVIHTKLANLSSNVEIHYNLQPKDSVFLVNPNFPCDSSKNCSEEHNTDMELECIDGNCECQGNQCWIYALQKDWIVWKIVFMCGECGQLGSECQRVHTSDCNYPGYCYEDGFCHCLEGEHSKDICMVQKGNMLLQFLFGGLVTFLVLIVMVLLYNTFSGYRSRRRVCCSRPSSHRRRNRGQQRLSRNENTIKTPSYISQQNVMQDFEEVGENSENVSESGASMVSTNASNVREDPELFSFVHASESKLVQSAPITSSSSSADILNTTTRKLTHVNLNESLFVETLNNSSDMHEPSSKQRSDSQELPILAVMDTSGMTDYFNHYYENTRL